MEGETEGPLGLAAGVATMTTSSGASWTDRDAARNNTAAGGIPTEAQVRENVWNQFFLRVSKI